MSRLVLISFYQAEAHEEAVLLKLVSLLQT